MEYVFKQINDMKIVEGEKMPPKKKKVVKKKKK